MGEVYEAQDLELRTSVAIKTIRTDSLDVLAKRSLAIDTSGATFHGRTTCLHRAR